jgi:hypothetical protein
MYQADAYEFLASELNAYRRLSYEELAQFVGESSAIRRRSEDSTEYVIEVKVRCCGDQHGKILVEGMAAVADCGPLRRLDQSFVILPPLNV